MVLIEEEKKCFFFKELFHKEYNINTQLQAMIFIIFIASKPLFPWY